MTDSFLEWLKDLITKNELEKFYHCKEWLAVAEEVKRLDNYECQECKRKGKVTTASNKNRKGNYIQMSVHHHKEVKKYPELALSIYYIDANGEEQRNLEYICESCHNKLHKRFHGRTASENFWKKKTQRVHFMNEERW